MRPKTWDKLSVNIDDVSCYIYQTNYRFTWYCTHILKIEFVVAEGVLFLLYQPNKSDKERKILRKKLSFMHTKRFNTVLKRWVQFCVGAIPRLP